MPENGKPERPEDWEDWEESPSRMHAHFDGIWHTLIDGKWVAMPDKDNEDLEAKAKSTFLQAVVDLMTGKASIPALMLGAFLFGGGGGAVRDKLFGENADHDKLATTAQIDEVTKAVSELRTDIAKLEAIVEAHERLEAHPDVVRSMDQMGSQITKTLKLIDTLHPRQR